MSIAQGLTDLAQAKSDIKAAIEAKGVSTTGVPFTEYDSKITEISGGSPSVVSQNIFSGATIPLTYLNNSHTYENIYEYTSISHDITISGLDNRATITGNGTKSVSVSFDVTSSTSSLKNFTITCVKDTQTLVYNGMHAHYGTTVTGVLTFAYTNITGDGSEGVIGSDYLFIETTTLPLFLNSSILWNGIYSYQILNLLLGNYTGIIANNFMSYGYSFNQPLRLPDGVTEIKDNFMYYNYGFNQPIIFSNTITAIGAYFMQASTAFNKKITLSNGLITIGTYFLSECYAFNQEIIIPNGVLTIGTNFMQYNYAFNQPITIPNSVTAIGRYFFTQNSSFNQTITLSNNMTKIDTGFLSPCKSFNQPIVIPNSVTIINDSFLADCYAFNQPLTIPSSVTTMSTYFLQNCLSFNQPLVIPNSMTRIPGNFLEGCRSFNQPIFIPNSVSIIDTKFLWGCMAFNQPVIIPSSVTSIGSYFMNSLASFGQAIIIPSSVTSISTYFMKDNYCQSSIVYNASVYPTDTNSLSQTINTKTSTSGSGIKVYGTNRAGLITALPNKTTSPYRKLINGGS